MGRPSQVEYAETGAGFVAYRTGGSGPPEVVLVSDWFSHVGDLWQSDSPFRPVLDAVSSYSRLITFDKLGVGLSDPVPLDGQPPLEEWVDEVQAVLDALGVDQATILGKGSGGPMAVLFAATHPERVSGLILLNAWARLARAPDFPIGASPAGQAEMLRTPYMPTETVRVLAGEHLPDGVEAWFQSYLRNAASPRTSLATRRWLLTLDVRAALPSVRCPTLVMAREGAWIGHDHARYLADRIEGARLLELPGSADLLFTGDVDAVLAAIEEFVTGARRSPAPDRVLATVLYTDLVGSTERASRLGDRRWRELLDRHDEVVRAALAAGSGNEVKSTGDGFLATFDGPARAIRAATAIRDDLRSLGLDVYAGLHAGEVEVRGTDIGGIAVHIAARVQALARPGEVLVSRTVRDLVAGSGLQFTDRGVHHLKGVPDEWQVFAVEG